MDMIEYYDYDEERDAPVNERQANSEDDKLSLKDEAMTNRGKNLESAIKRTTYNK